MTTEWLIGERGSGRTTEILLDLAMSLALDIPCMLVADFQQQVNSLRDKLIADYKVSKPKSFEAIVGISSLESGVMRGRRISTLYLDDPRNVNMMLSLCTPYMNPDARLVISVLGKAFQRSAIPYRRATRAR
jgi:hypothetical protein